MLLGATQLTVAAALPAEPNAAVGAPGRLVGVTGEDGADALPVPFALLAVAVNV